MCKLLRHQARCAHSPMESGRSTLCWLCLEAYKSHYPCSTPGQQPGDCKLSCRIAYLQCAGAGGRLAHSIDQKGWPNGQRSMMRSTLLHGQALQKKKLPKKPNPCRLQSEKLTRLDPNDVFFLLLHFLQGEVEFKLFWQTTQQMSRANAPVDPETNTVPNEHAARFHNLPRRLFRSRKSLSLRQIAPIWKHHH